MMLPAIPPALRFSILGPLQVLKNGRPLHLGPRKQQLALAVLLCHANTRVSNDSRPAGGGPTADGPQEHPGIHVGPACCGWRSAGSPGQYLYFFGGWGGKAEDLMSQRPIA
jgi:hypothetical protein